MLRKFAQDYQCGKITTDAHDAMVTDRIATICIADAANRAACFAYHVAPLARKFAEVTVDTDRALLRVNACTDARSKAHEKFLRQCANIIRKHVKFRHLKVKLRMASTLMKDRRDS
jgi:hypothetical protein